MYSCRKTLWTALYKQSTCHPLHDKNNVYPLLCYHIHYVRSSHGDGDKRNDQRARQVRALHPARHTDDRVRVPVTETGCHGGVEDNEYQKDTHPKGYVAGCGPRGRRWFRIKKKKRKKLERSLHYL